MNEFQQTLRYCLINLRNLNNEIRTQSEIKINELIKSDFIRVCEELFRIIDENLSSEDVYLCAIIINKIIEPKNLIDLNLISNEYFLKIRNNFMRLASDSKFNQNTNFYFLTTLANRFYALSFFPNFPQFQEFIPFLINLLDKVPLFRSNSLKIICQIFKFALNQLEPYSRDILSKCDLNSSDFEFRSHSFMLYIFSFIFNDEFFQPLMNNLDNILSPLPDKDLITCIYSILYMIHEKECIILSSFYPIIFSIIISRIQDEQTDELTKINYIYFISIMLDMSSFIDFLLDSENATKFLFTISLAASNPIQFEDLYIECLKCIKKLSKIKEAQNFYYLFKQFINISNLFVASLFCSTFISLDYYHYAIQFASKPDEQTISCQLIRKNGLSQIKKIIREFGDSNSEIMLKIGQDILNLYETFQDNEILKVLAIWTEYVPNEILYQAKDSIISILENHITSEIICCAASFCSNEFGDTRQLGIHLLTAIISIINQKPEELSLFINYIPKIFTTLDPITIASFLEQALPAFYDNPLCLTKKFLLSFIKANRSIMKNIPEQIFEKLFDIITNLINFIVIKSIPNNTDDEDVNTTILFYALRRVPFYSTFNKDFELNYLDKLMGYISQTLTNNDYRIRAASVCSIIELLNLYPINLTIFQAAIQILFNSDGEYNSYVITKILQLFSQIIDSPQLSNEELIEKLISFYPQLFEHSYNIIIKIKSDGKVADPFQIEDISVIISSLLTIFNLLLSKFPNHSAGIFQAEFIDNNKYNIPEFNEFFIKAYSVILTTSTIESVHPDIIQNVINNLLKILCGADDSLKGISISILSEFFGIHEMPIELITTFLELIVPIIQSSNLSKSTANLTISALIIIEAKYYNKGIDFYQLLGILLQNIDKLCIVNSLTFQCLVELGIICSTKNETMSSAQLIANTLIAHIKNKTVELRAIEIIRRQLKANAEISEIFHPFVNALFMIE